VGRARSGIRPRGSPRRVEDPPAARLAPAAGVDGVRGPRPRRARGSAAGGVGRPPAAPRGLPRRGGRRPPPHHPADPHRPRRGSSYHDGPAPPVHPHRRLRRPQRTRPDDRTRRGHPLAPLRARGPRWRRAPASGVAGGQTGRPRGGGRAAPPSALAPQPGRLRLRGVPPEAGPPRRRERLRQRGGDGAGLGGLRTGANRGGRSREGPREPRGARPARRGPRRPPGPPASGPDGDRARDAGGLRPHRAGAPAGGLRAPRVPRGHGALRRAQAVPPPVRLGVAAGGGGSGRPHDPASGDLRRRGGSAGLGDASARDGDAARGRPRRGEAVERAERPRGGGAASPPHPPDRAVSTWASSSPSPRWAG
jgi:hypothetical protein